MDELADHPDRYDVCLLDMHLPDMTGLDIAKAFRMMHPKQALPMIALTASPDAQLREACLDNGFVAFRTKPIDFQDLLQTIAQQLKTDTTQNVAEVEPHDEINMDTLRDLEHLGADNDVLYYRIVQNRRQPRLRTLSCSTEHRIAAWIDQPGAHGRCAGFGECV